MPKPTLDAFVWALMRQAREFGQQEERERVCAYLRKWSKDASDGPWFADEIEQGVHDGGRPFKPLDWTWPDEDDSTEPNGNGNPATANGQGDNNREQSKRERLG